MRCWRTWQGNNHYRRPPPSLARFLAATRLALKRQQTLGCLLLACLPLVTLAASEDRRHGLIGSNAETQTEYWLRVQRDGLQASRHAQVSTPAERELAMQRWLESHKHPIPEFFDQEAGGELSK
ncbi:hypothetical protein DNK10_12240 [Pseudomonas daroniae]|nr:hypothetical protein DNK10_12240 [Pseudomonas daroniae]